MVKVLKTVIILAVISSLLVAMVIMPGCKTETPEEPIDEGMSVTVTDGEGNLIELEKPAEKIVVFAPSVLEIIDGLGAIDKVSEIDNFTVMMQEPLSEGFEGVGDYHRGIPDSQTGFFL